MKVIELVQIEKIIQVTDIEFVELERERKKISMFYRSETTKAFAHFRSEKKKRVNCQEP